MARCQHTTVVPSSLQNARLRQPPLVLTTPCIQHCVRNNALLALLQREYVMAVRMASRPDFVEGVRAVVVDKDRQASWAPASWRDVREEEVEAMFGELPAGLGLLLG
jgi:hypothetical protein